MLYLLQGPGSYIKSPVGSVLKPKMSDLEAEMLQLAKELGEHVVPAPIRHGKLVPAAVKNYS